MPGGLKNPGYVTDHCTCLHPTQIEKHLQHRKKGKKSIHINRFVFRLMFQFWDVLVAEKSSQQKRINGKSYDLGVSQWDGNPIVLKLGFAVLPIR